MTRREKRTSRKGMKRSLAASILAIVLCVVLLAGATFAWFTSQASTSISEIKSGTLKVEITGGTDGTLKFVKAANGASPTPTDAASILWEPGATYRTEGFKVKNSGSLSLRYKLYITLPEATKANADLLDAIDFSVVTDDNNGGYKEMSLDAFAATLSADTEGSETYYIQGHMREGAGNRYQDKSLTGVSVLLLATQAPEEYDSYTNEYDAAADLPERIDLVISTASGLRTFAERVNKGETFEGQTVVLTEDINLNQLKKAFTPIGSKEQNISFKGTFDGLGCTVENLSITDGTYTGLFGQIENATIRNLTVTGNVSGTDMAGLCGKGLGNITVENVTVDVKVSGTTKAAGFFAGIDSQNADNSVVFTNCVNLGDVTGTTHAAGLVAWFGAKGNYEFTNCKNTGNLSVGAPNDNQYYTGGLVAYCNGAAGYTGTLTNCENTGTIINSGSLKNAAAGGLLGHADQETTKLIVTDCRNSGVVSGLLAGGLIGDANCILTITNAVNSGSVTNGSAKLSGENNVVGGIVGLARNATGASTLTNCVNSGSVRLSVGSATSPATTNAYAAGGIVGNVGSNDTNGTYTLANCANSGDVSAAGSVSTNSWSLGVCAGGIAGYVQNSNASVTISSPLTDGSVKLTSSTYPNHYGSVVGHFYQGNLTISGATSAKDNTDASGIGTVGQGTFTKG